MNCIISSIVYTGFTVQPSFMYLRAKFCTIADFADPASPVKVLTILKFSTSLLAFVSTNCLLPSF